MRSNCYTKIRTNITDAKLRTDQAILIGSLIMSIPGMNNVLTSIGEKTDDLKIKMIIDNIPVRTMLVGMFAKALINIVELKYKEYNESL